MARVYRLPDIGDIVEVRQGREAGQFMVVIGRLDDRYVWLADGDKRTVERPKKKNVLHVRPTGKRAEEALARLHTMGKVTDADLRFCLRRFLRERTRSADEDNRNMERGVD
ncbi:MAG: KOW domain-containing RNA-binding protein [Alicyclobacillaceae bacterium]|nr:KOW domain-containing RNA-binding protein [Alicyclobacillaceae bacterium]